MKKLGQLLSIILTISMILAFVPSVSYAAENVLPVKLEFNTDGAFPSGTDGITYGSGAMTVQDGVLRMTTRGTDLMYVKNGTTQYPGGTYLYYDFADVTNGTLVFETEVSLVQLVCTEGFVNMYDNQGKEIVRLSVANNAKSKWYVNGEMDYKLDNAAWGSDLVSVKVEVDLGTKKWRAYQAKSKVDGAWKYNQLKRTKNGVVEEEFPFYEDSANVSKLRIGLYELNAGIDNFKVYKKVTATQSVTSYDMLAGGTQQASITFSPAADKPSDLVWSSLNEGIATVDGNGNITAVAEGTTTINVKSTFYDHINYNFTVNVVRGAEEIKLNKETATICVADEITLTASPFPENTAFRELEWESSDDSIATVNSEGKVTGIGRGTATITASAIGKNGTTISASAVINVIKPLTGLSISASDTSLSVGERTTFTAVAAPADASEVAKKWRSANHYIATVDQNGVVTAVSEGTTEIYVSASNFTASQTITVTANNDDENVRKPALISFYTPTGYSFYDIDGMEWAQSAVYSAVESGVINPDSETIFGAKRNIKRDEFVSVVIKTLKLSNKKGSAENQEALKNFTDVPESNPYYAEIMKALELGIIQGVSETQFAPDADITRQDMSVVVSNALKVAAVKVEEGRLDFADKASIAEYAQTSIRILSKMGIIVGKSNNMFDPLANTTRAEVCVIVDRINALR